MRKQWNELKAVIKELRDSGGMGTQREVCEYLVNLMAVIEKQMQEPCDDCISRQAAIDDIRTMIPKDAQFDIKWIEMWLKQLPSVQPEQKWIPVSERLPEPYTPVLISAVQEGCDFVACGTTRKVGIMHRKLEWVDDDGFPVKVVAWMPLPEAYKAERREE